MAIDKTNVEVLHYYVRRHCDVLDMYSSDELHAVHHFVVAADTSSSSIAPVVHGEHDA